MICQNCKTNLQGDFKFCPSCGSPSTKKPICPQCRKETDPGWAVCPHCGCRLNAAPVQINPQPQALYEPSHGYHRGSSSRRSHGGHPGNYNRKKGFLGRLFSS